MTKEFVRLLDEISAEQIINSYVIQAKFKQFQRFHSPILDIELKENEANEIDTLDINLKKFIRYVMNDGEREEKRELIGCIKADLYLHDKQIEIRS